MLHTLGADPNTGLTGRNCGRAAVGVRGEPAAREEEKIDAAAVPRPVQGRYDPHPARGGGRFVRRRLHRRRPDGIL